MATAKKQLAATKAAAAKKPAPAPARAPQAAATNALTMAPRAPSRPAMPFAQTVGNLLGGARGALMPALQQIPAMTQAQQTQQVPLGRTIGGLLGGVRSAVMPALQQIPAMGMPGRPQLPPELQNVLNAQQELRQREMAMMQPYQQRVEAAVAANPAYRQLMQLTQQLGPNASPQQLQQLQQLKAQIDGDPAFNEARQMAQQANLEFQQNYAQPFQQEFGQRLAALQQYDQLQNRPFPGVMPGMGNTPFPPPQQRVSPNDPFSTLLSTGHSRKAHQDRLARWTCTTPRTLGA